jgi:NADPH:quinone reductase-like Zn-dependent oxidoreductase
MRTMHAIVRHRYGPPDVLAYQEVAVPALGDHDVLVQVHAAGISIGDHHVLTGKPYVIRPSVGGLLRPKHHIPGSCMAGRVEAVGAQVANLRPGDEVYGETTHGAFAEYVVVPAARLAPKPRNLSFAEAAATPWAVTPLQALRDAGRLQAGQNVLINGASGGVGTWAVQIAKALGARVTAVCSTRNVARMRALGADDVIDYTTTDFVTLGPRFDVMLDTVGNRSLVDCRRVLAPAGIFVSCSGGTSGTRWLVRMVGMLVTSRFSTRKLKPFIVSLNQPDLLVLTELVEAGKIKPFIERTYQLPQAADAYRHVGEGHAQGQTVIRMREET